MTSLQTLLLSMLTFGARCGKVLPFSSNEPNAWAVPHRTSVTCITAGQYRTAAFGYSHGFKTHHPSRTSTVHSLQHVRRLHNARSRSNHSIQAASTAQQQSLPNLSGSGAGGLLPSTILSILLILHMVLDLTVKLLQDS